jgi:hypothetical protein
MLSLPALSLFNTNRGCPGMRAIVMLSACVFLSGCKDKTDTSLTINSQPEASVNGEIIFTADVDFMLKRMAKDQHQVQADETFRKKILDSLITSRAMRQSVEAELSDVQRDEIKNSVKAYEEELFVKAYLQKNVVPQPVTGEMVQQYYDQHLQDFGGQTLRDFQLLRATVATNEELRNQLLQAIPQIRNATDWEQKASGWQQQYKLQFQQGRSKPGLFSTELDQILARLQKGQTSDVFYIDGELYLLRVTDVSEVAAQPLAQVSADIRKRLAAQVLRDAVKEASEIARAKAKIELLATEKH